MKLSGLYAIIDPDHCPGRDPLSLSEAVLRGGCTALQLRWKSGSDAARIELARRMAFLANSFEVPFIVNDRVDIALVAGADGVHLGQDDLGPADARLVLSERQMLIGRSTHTLEQALNADREAIDHLAFGPVFPTSSKERPDPTVGLDELARVIASVHKPVVAIGGIGIEQLPALVAAKVQVAACISALATSQDPEAAARAIHSTLRAPR